MCAPRDVITRCLGRNRADMCFYAPCKPSCAWIRRHFALRGAFGSARNFRWTHTPWSKSRRNRRIRKIRQLIEQLPKNEVAVYADEVDIHLNPKIGADWMLCGQQKTVVTPGQNVKRYVAGALDARTRLVRWVAATHKRRRVVHRSIEASVAHVSLCEADPCDRGQLQYPQQPTDHAGVGGVSADSVALPATVCTGV